MKKREHPEIRPDYIHHSYIYHPCLIPMPDVPIPNHYGSFMAKRRHDIHRGVDLYCPPGSDVYSVEAGEVVHICDFTGTNDGTDFWNDTRAVYIEGYTGVICYGEIEEKEGLKVGDQIKMGERIGHVVPVLKKDKGKAMSMLHFELHSHGFMAMVQNNADPNTENYYTLQIDPTMLLIQLKAKYCCS